MAEKKYRRRVLTELASFKASRFLHEPFVNLSTHEEVGEVFAELVSQLRLKHMDPVRRAFDDTGLNPNNPFCWGELLSLFAKVHYTSGKEGRPLIRSLSYDERFAIDLYEVYRDTGKWKPVGLSLEFLNHHVSGRDIYKSLKKVGGVRSAIYALERRQGKEWREFATEIMSRSDADDEEE
ncbi:MULTISPECIES: hypothetical protein [Bradyrhizobium]|jgi:hypothetical protein|uniref:hypothetical protein n=1 Tax=Bradyrhizobium TaxID=374 RepID=UPI00046314E4|nr:MULTISPECIES: hypothetical protein [Bradyrhizobium]KIU50802.1 hypothetical protein QU41_06815 [Bradyrhizobium elkanii]OCX32836.1 hypothetical protein QU42_02065 [Bradyrhizobium sp. UASWS1016]